MMMEIWCLVTDEYADTLGRSGEVENAARVRELVEGAHAEIRKGSYFSQIWRMVVGRK